MKTAEVCGKATGGVLFIDEAYALGGDDYGTESINTLVKEMEDERDKLVVIVAGYTQPMVVFMAQNPGLSSRFKTVIEFDDYTDDELVQILRKLASAADYDITREAEMTFRGILAGAARTQAFGNGRFARNLLEEAIGRHAWRLQDVEDPTREQLRELKAEDFRQLAGESGDVGDDPEAAGVDPDPEGAREPQGTAQTSEGDPAREPGDDELDRPAGDTT
jgi:AAA+ superfamily predicted ATPase